MPRLQRFAAALLGAPVGLKGYIRLRSLSGEEGHIRRLGRWVLRLPGGGERTMEAEAFSGGGASLAVKFAGCDTPEAARALTGSELLLDRSEAAALGPGEYYVEDLKGLEVLGPAAESLGRVTDIVEGGGGLLMEIELSSTGELRLAPFRDGFVGEIDTEGGWVRLEAPWVLE